MNRNVISIHAPRGGSDVNVHEVTNTAQSISIHAPRGGSDKLTILFLPWYPHFNPRSPWGERQYRYHHQHKTHHFQSTLPVGGATRP